ncbi:MAG: UDP-N-acetylmuramoyl-tripeptide--D-alanyl-D-alanine ligase [Alphaproteobacteria bacterium]|nr:UDP-N-acetylmuramoyl-tripeptide--D-alanyl-D-alanine ligase [Alphaproteobacteria bacterium]
MNNLWTAAQINKLFSCALSPEWSAKGVSIDSRSLVPGQIYVALKGAKLDGHDFVSAAVAAGASAVIVEKSMDVAVPQILVENALDALRLLAQSARSVTESKVAGITGSVGKTSTKEALLFILQDQAATYATPRSFNNHWGLPLSVANMPGDAAYSIIEMGMNHRGEIAGHTQLARPHVAYITNIEAVHLGNLGSIQAIAEAKSEIFEGLVPGGICILNSDSQQLDVLEAAARKANPAEIWFVGTTAKANVRLYESEVFSDHQIVHADIAGVKLTYRLNVMGPHWVLNSLGILAVVKALGADVELAAAKLQDFQAIAGRGQTHLVDLTHHQQIMVIDDSYNAGPVSMKAAIHVLGQSKLTPQSRRIAVLGDMYEIGPQEVEEHVKLAEILVQQNIHCVYTSGALMKNLYDALPDSMRGRHEDDPKKLADLLLKEVQAGDIYMVKGSRGGYQEKGRMYAVVEALLQMQNGKKERAV